MNRESSSSPLSPGSRTLFARLFLLFAILLRAIPILSSQTPESAETVEPPDLSGIDAIIGNPQDDTVIEDGGSLLDEFEKPEPLGFAVDLSSTLAVYGGLSRWDSIEEEGAAVVGGAYGLSNTLGFSAKLDKTLKFQGGISFSYPDYVLVLDNISFDYTLADTVYFKGGKFSFTWGNGRFFNIGNLADGIADGIALRAYVPIGVLGWTAVFFAKPEFFNDPASPSIADVGYASLIELALPGFEFTLAGRYQRASGLDLSGGVKTSVEALDIFGEVRSDLSTDFSDPDFSVMAGFFYEWKEPKVRLYGEYMWAESERSGWDYGDHQSSVALKWYAPNSPNVQVGLQWSHEWADMSGVVVPGISFDPIDHISVNIGLPIRYGSDGGYYRSATPPGFDTDFPAGQALLLVEVKLSGTFR